MPDIYEIYREIRLSCWLYDISPVLTAHAFRLNLELPA